MMTVMTVRRSHQLHLKDQGEIVHMWVATINRGIVRMSPYTYLDVCTVQWFGVSERDNDREGN